MKLRWTSQNKNLIKFIISLFIIAILIGVFVYIKEPNLVKGSISNELKDLTLNIKSSKQNSFIYHLIVLSVLSILSLLVIGLPLMLFYFFYEGVSIGFLMAGFFQYKKAKGLLFSGIFILVNKSAFYAILIYLLIVSLQFAKKLYFSAKNKDYKIYELAFIHLIKIGFIFLIILLSDIFIYYWGNKIIAYFLFLL